MIIRGLTLVSSLKLELFVFLGSSTSVLWLAFSLLLLPDKHKQSSEYKEGRSEWCIIAHAELHVLYLYELKPGHFAAFVLN